MMQLNSVLVDSLFFFPSSVVMHNRTVEAGLVLQASFSERVTAWVTLNWVKKNFQLKWKTQEKFLPFLSAENPADICGIQEYLELRHPTARRDEQHPTSSQVRDKAVGVKLIMIGTKPWATVVRSMISSLCFGGRWIFVKKWKGSGWNTKGMESPSGCNTKVVAVSPSLGEVEDIDFVACIRLEVVSGGHLGSRLQRYKTFGWVCEAYILNIQILQSSFTK